MSSFWLSGMIGLNAEYFRLLLIGLFFIILVSIFFMKLSSLNLALESFGILIIAVMSFLIFPISTVMSFLRLSCYMMLYVLISNKALNFNVPYVVKIAAFLAIFAFGIQFLFSDYQYLNGFKRYSGLYYMHSAGFALLSQLLVFEYYLMSFSGKNHYGSVIRKTFVLILLMVCLFMTGSRSSTIITFCGLVYLNFRKNMLRKVLGIFGILCLGIWLFPIIENSSYFYRINTLFSRGLVDASSQNRLSFLENGFGLVESEYMLFGYGVGRFDDLYVAEFGERLAAHFYPLQWFVEGGIVYVILWLTFYFRLLISVSHSRRILGLLFLIVASINNGEYYFSVYILFLLIMLNNGGTDESHNSRNRLRGLGNGSMSVRRGY